MAATYPPETETRGETSSTSSRTSECVQFPDIYEPIPDRASRAERERIEADNLRRERVYLAVRYILIHNFGLRDGVPEDPSHFAETPALSAAERSRFCAIYGQLLADNWTDPSLGREFKTEGDLEVPGRRHKDDVVLVNRRFVDAAVQAVQQYSSASKLFNRVFGFLRESATEDADTRPRA